MVRSGLISLNFGDIHPNSHIKTFLPEADQILLETFGFAYDEDLNRAVASFLWYLSCLSPEHQRLRNSKELGPEYKVHPDYFRSSITGDFPKGISMFHAFLHEQRIISEMTGLRRADVELHTGAPIRCVGKGPKEGCNPP